MSYYIFIDVDFLVNKSIPRFTYNANNTINIIFITFQSVNDNIVERSEKAVLSLRLNVFGRFMKTDNCGSQHDTIDITILDKNSKYYDDMCLIQKFYQHLLKSVPINFNH